MDAELGIVRKPPGLQFHEVIHLNNPDPFAVAENPGFIL